MIEYFIVSDLHAQYDLLKQALERADFDMDNQNHILIIAGDVLDRGHQGDELIRFLEKLIVMNRLMGVMGNHDKFLIDVITQSFTIKTVLWNSHNNGFIETLRLAHPKKDFYIEEKTIKEIGHAFLEKYPIFSDWLLQLPLFLEFKNHVIVHGFLNFDLPDWHDTEEHFAIWERGYNNDIPETFHKKIIFGHTPNHYINHHNDIIFNGKKIMIDGGAASGIQINVLKLTEQEI